MKKLFLIFSLISLSTNSQTKLLIKIDSLLNLGNYKSALIQLENSNSKTFETLNKTGNIYQQIGDYTKAIFFYEKALDLNLSQKTKENLGKCYQKNNKSEKAILLFEEVLQDMPNHLLLKYHVAKLYRSKRFFKKAKVTFKDLIRNDDSNPNYYYYLGSTYLNLKEKDTAKIHFLNALKKDSIHFKSIYNLAKIYRKKQNKFLKNLPKRYKVKFKNDSSYFYLNKGLYHYPKSNALNQLASKYSFTDKNYQKTIDYLLTLKYLNPENKQTLAICYYYIKEYEKSKDYLYALIDGRKATSKTFFYLALVYKDEKDFEKAEMYMQSSIKMEKPQLTEFYFQLGLIHQEYNKLQEAIEDFKIALEENKYNDKALYQLALTCDSFYKDHTIAIKHYKSYLKKFHYRDKETSLFVKQRIAELNRMIHK